MSLTAANCPLMGHVVTSHDAGSNVYLADPDGLCRVFLQGLSLIARQFGDCRDHSNYKP